MTGLRFIAFQAAAWLVFCLTAAFFVWDINPANWSEFTRATVAAISLFFGALIWSIYEEHLS